MDLLRKRALDGVAGVRRLDFGEILGSCWLGSG